MRHRKAHRKLGRTTEHRLALLRNLATSLFQEERLTTTLGKAKELRSYAERLITRAKDDSVHSRRLVAKELRDRSVVRHLFTEIAPRFSDRPGGYTRIMRMSHRRGDGAEMAMIELVELKEKPADLSTDGDAGTKKKGLGKLLGSKKAAPSEKSEG